MKKHVREAIRLAGLAPGQVEIHQRGNHPYVVINGRKIFFSFSPKNSDHTTINIAKDIRKVLDAQV